MRKRTKFKSLVLDFFVVTVCLSVAGYYSYVFWKDLNSTARRNDKEKIAIITFKNRIAQRKFDDRVVWERIDKSTPLYNGDLVRTSDLAEAVITFNDGSKIDIYENTMIQVYYSDFEGVQISVGNGNLQLESSDNGKVQLTLNDGSKVNASGGASLAAKTSAGKTGAKSIEVHNGTATVTGAAEDSQAVAITAGESVSVKTSGEISKKPVTVTSLPPELRVLNIGGEEQPVKLEWNKIKSGEPVILQTSTKKDYSEIKEEKIIVSENDALIDIPEGTLYWRVFPQSKPDEASEGKILVESAKALTLTSPAQGTTLQYRNRNPSVNFSWNGNKYANNYLLKVSSTPDMKNEILSKIVETPYAQVDSLGKGQWWWQVTPYYEINSLGYADAGASNVASFSIEKIDAINPPSLTVPLQNAEIYYKDYTYDLTFSWKSDIKASYELLIASDPDFNHIIASQHTAGHRTTMNLPMPQKDGDKYYWKVIRSSSELEDLTPESDVRTYSVSKYVSLPTKLLYPPEEFTTEAAKLPAVRFMWKPSDEAKAHDSVVQISTSQDFTKPLVEKTVTGTTLENINLPRGEYYWRVATQNSDGKLEYTQPNHLSVQKALTAPEITNIKNNARLVLARDSAVNFTWTPVEDADYYNIKIFDSNNKLIAEKPEARGTSTNFVLYENTYSVKIQAVSSQTESSPLRTGPVESLDFSVHNPTPITALSPAPAAKIDGLTALRTPVSFSWKEGSDKAVKTELVLRKLQADGSYKVVERMPLSKNTASLPRLTSGTYNWQVMASTKEGIPINSKSSDFTITKVVALAKPALTSPKKDFIMDSKFLRKNRSITFEWKEVPGATDYNFVLYKIDRNGKLTPVWSEKNIRGTKVKLRKLNMLDVGYFEWNVTAFSLAKDGFEENRSPAGESTFRISFDAPSQIKTEQKDRIFIEE